jgi:hypothetical protein
VELVPEKFAMNVRGLLTMGFVDVDQCVATLIKHANDLNLCLEELSQLKARRVDQPPVLPEEVPIEFPPMFLDRIEQLKNMGFTVSTSVCAGLLCCSTGFVCLFHCLFHCLPVCLFHGVCFVRHRGLPLPSR